MDWTIIGSVLVIGAVAGVIGWRQFRDDTTPGVIPQDVRRFEDHYGPRGYKVLAARRLGRIRGPSRRRDGPIRTYELDLELPDGRRETRVRGIARSEMGGHRVWRVGPDGRVEQQF